MATRRSSRPSTDLQHQYKVLGIHLELAQYPILAHRIRELMRQELFSKGIISLDAFEAEEQKHTRAMLAQSLAGIVSQFLVARVDKPGRIPVTEVLVRTSAVPNVIREGNSSLLISIIQGGKKQGMSSMDDRLMSLLESGIIAAEEAYMRAYDKTPFEHYLD